MQATRRRVLTLAGGAAAATFANVLLGEENGTVHEDIRRSAGRAELAMQFKGSTANEFAAWRAAFEKRLHELLGDTAPPKSWKAVEERRTELDDHVRFELLLESEGVPSVPVYLLVPKGASARAPRAGVLCVHGHGDYGHHTVAGRHDLPGLSKAIERANYDYGLQFVRRGYVVAAPCMIPFGRRVDKEKYGSDPCAVTFVRMQSLGQLPMAANLRDLRWCLDLLQSRHDVWNDRLGCAGLSYGGRMTMLVSAVNPRIQVAAVSGALNLLQERMTLRHSCGSQIIPGLLRYGDYSEIGSLIAPRPCVWEVGSDDGLIVPVWSDLFRERLRLAYRAAGRPEALQFDDFEGGHRWSGAVAFPLFARTLRQPAG